MDGSRRIAVAISRVREVEEQTDGQPWLGMPVRAPGYGPPTILVVDDEPLVRAFTSEVLGLEGYVVLEAAGPAEGLRVAAEHPGPIDLVISDVVMPGGDGRDLVERLGRMRPTIKALYISGHIEANVARGGTLRSAAFLQKPFTMNVLVEKVSAVLDAAEARIAGV
jgi:two-component system, cell cycle sensor histidine kinase and response regulator CckA